MMNEYCINGLTIKENLLRLAGEGNKKFTESLHPGIEMYWVSVSRPFGNWRLK